VFYIECVLNMWASYYQLSCVVCTKYGNKFCEQFGCSYIVVVHCCYD